MFDADATDGVAARTPPYVAFPTFLTLMEDMKGNGLPPQIDRSVLKRFSGGVGSQIQAALKSLGLTDEKHVPTERLDLMVKSYGTEAFKEHLRQTLKDSYPFLQKIDLRTATPTMFAEAFKSGTNAKEDVLKKCRRFFLYAAQYCDVEIGPRLQGGAIPKAGGSASPRRRSKTKTARVADDGDGGGRSAGGDGGGGFNKGPTPPSDPVGVLVSIIDMSAMDEDEQQAVWTLIRYLKKREATKKDGAS
jgi:hypothetical protein